MSCLTLAEHFSPCFYPDRVIVASLCDADGPARLVDDGFYRLVVLRGHEEEMPPRVSMTEIRLLAQCSEIVLNLVQLLPSDPNSGSL